MSPFPVIQTSSLLHPAIKPGRRKHFQRLPYYTRTLSNLAVTLSSNKFRLEKPIYSILKSFRLPGDFGMLSLLVPVHTLLTTSAHTPNRSLLLLCVAFILFSWFDRSRLLNLAKTGFTCYNQKKK